MPLAAREGPLRLKLVPRDIRYIEIQVIPTGPKPPHGPVWLDVFPPPG